MQLRTIITKVLTVLLIISSRVDTFPVMNLDDRTGVPIAAIYPESPDDAARPLFPMSNRTKPELEPTDIPLHILEYNIWNLPGIMTDGHSRERAQGIANHLKNRTATPSPYDVIILLEAFRNKDIFLNDPELLQMYPYRATLKRQWYTLFDSGMLILSKFKILSEEGVHYPRRTHTDFWAAKGLLYLQLQVSDDGKVLDLFATHMQSNKRKIDQASRWRQVELVKQWVQEKTQGSQAVVFCGDLNMGPTADYQHLAPFYSDVADAEQRNAAYTDMRDGSGLNESDASESPEDISRVLYKGNAVVWSEVHLHDWQAPEGGRLSDTSAVEADIILRYA